MLYFAYGSNLNQEDLKEWCVRHCKPILELRMRSVGLLRGRCLDFTACSKARHCGVADIVLDEKSAVYGVVFEVSSEEVEVVDEKAGIKGGQYKRNYVTVHLMPSGAVEEDVLTYEVVNKKLGRYKPSQEYLDVIIKGAQAYGLPLASTEKMKSFETT
jgi:hypothetical protein